MAREEKYLLVRNAMKKEERQNGRIPTNIEQSEKRMVRMSIIEGRKSVFPLYRFKWEESVAVQVRGTF